MEGGVHITCYTRVSVYPPSPSNARLPFENPKLVESELLLHSASQSYAGLASAHNEDGIVGVSIFPIAIDPTDGVLGVYLHGLE